MAVRAVFSHLVAGVAALTAFTAAAEPVSGVVESPDGRVGDDYVPAMLSNGRLCVFCDYTLSVPREEPRYEKKKLRPGIWWEGRRYGDNSGKASRFGYQFFPQGRLATRLVVDGAVQKAPASWRQRLDVRTAMTTVSATYGGGVRLDGEMFVPRARNLIAVRQTVTAADAPREVEIGVSYMSPRAERLVGAWTTDAASATWKMTAYARFVTHETIAVRTADGSPCDVKLVDGNAELTRKVRLAPGESRTFTWYVAYADDLSASLPSVTPVPEEKGPVPDYAALRAAHVADWAAYFAESEIDVPDARIKAMSDMARYHLRCNATEWSIPVGVIQSHWQGRIFAFDEMYGVQGLLSAGHFSTAKVAADFRSATLRDACVRNNKNSKNPFYSHGARWVWEAAEGNEVESCPIGYWQDHVFHSAAVAQTVWTYYRYTGDLGYLKEKGYDVLRECALFFRRLCVQDMPDGTSFVTKCTDLERMGPGRDHAFMTTCGVIATLRAAARAADLVGKDAGLAADFRACAGALSVPGVRTRQRRAGRRRAPLPRERRGVRQHVRHRQAHLPVVRRHDVHRVAPRGRRGASARPLASGGVQERRMLGRVLGDQRAQGVGVPPVVHDGGGQLPLRDQPAVRDGARRRAPPRLGRAVRLEGLFVPPAGAGRLHHRDEGRGREACAPSRHAARSIGAEAAHRPARGPGVIGVLLHAARRNMVQY